MIVDNEADGLRPGDRIICKDERDMAKHEKIFKRNGIETIRAEECGKKVLVVITREEAAFRRLKRAYENIINASRGDQTTRDLINDIGVAVKALEPGKTNGDKIRRMSNLQLAIFMMDIAATELDEKIHFCQNKAECKADPEGVDQQKCIGCVVRWLEEQ